MYKITFLLFFLLFSCSKENDTINPSSEKKTCVKQALFNKDGSRVYGNSSTDYNFKDGWCNSNYYWKTCGATYYTRCTWRHRFE